ncbi:MAG: hypothetical protein GEU79_18370, partial [Acidimicrobiia bacterium]|nr:hypothetical protein [Acidimicrobiia bacterium]
MTTVHQLKVTLGVVKPPVWRRLAVRSDMMLGELAGVLEGAMGWMGGHLHVFDINGVTYGNPDPEWAIADRDENRYPLGVALPTVGSTMRWDYDFGDGWEHQVEVEEIGSPEQGVDYPVCIEGGRACPPEDCGGPPGYENLLSAWRNPDHPQHVELSEWVPPGFDPKRFDPGRATAAMRERANGGGDEVPLFPVPEPEPTDDDDDGDQEMDDLLGAFATWSQRPGLADHAHTTLTYKRWVGDDRLRWWQRRHIDEMLLHYLPEKVVLDSDDVPETVEAFCRFLEFLAAEDLMDPDSDDVGDLIAHTRNHTDEVVELMSDPNRGSPATRLVMAMLEEGVDMDNPDDVSAWIEAFNDGPIEHRDEVLGPLGDFGDIDDLDEGPGIVLAPQPQVPEELARESAAQAPILARFRDLAEYMGEGRKLTDKGNLKLADARSLIELLETDDVMDEVIGDRPFKTQSATELVWLDMIEWWARETGAVKVGNNRMSATKAWLKRATDPLVVMTPAAQTVFSVGPMTMLLGDGPFNASDAAVIPLLAGLYEGDLAFEAIVDLLMSVDEMGSTDPGWNTPERRRLSARWDADRIVKVMEMSGLLTRYGGHTEMGKYGGEEWHGGTVSMTPFGAWMVQNHLPETGMVDAPTVPALEVTRDDPAPDIVAALARFVEAGPEALVAAWEELGGGTELLDRLWRVDNDDTATVLAALGDTLTDKKMAKTARKAVI